MFFDDALATADRRRRRREQRLEGGHGHCWPSSAAPPRSASRWRFRNELDEIVEVARPNGAIDDPVIRQRLASPPTPGSRSCAGTPCACCRARRARAPPPAAMITKLYWATWHRDLGELAMDVLGAEATARPSRRGRPRAQGYELTDAAAAVPLHPLRHHLRRLQPDPAQHHRRAGPRPAGRAQGRPQVTAEPAPHPSATSPATACSPARPWW